MSHFKNQESEPVTSQGIGYVSQQHNKFALEAESFKNSGMTCTWCMHGDKLFTNSENGKCRESNVKIRDGRKSETGLGVQIRMLLFINHENWAVYFIV